MEERRSVVFFAIVLLFSLVVNGFEDNIYESELEGVTSEQFEGKIRGCRIQREHLSKIIKTLSNWGVKGIFV